MQNFFKSFSLMLCACLPILCFGQTFRYTQYTTHEGLPIDNVYAAAKDGNGFIWFGTDFGVTRFDGYKFTSFYKTDGSVGKAITDIVYAGGDSLIFFSYPTSIQSIHYNGKINTLVENTLLSLHQLTKHNNEYYCLTRKEKNFGLFKDGVFKIISADSFLNTKGVVVNAIVSLTENGVGFCTNKGLYVKNKNQISLFLPNQNVNFVVYKKDKTLVGVSNNNLVQSSADFTFTQLPFSFPQKTVILHMAVNDNGSIWYRGLDNGVYRFENNKLEEMSERLGLQNKNVNEFFTDAENNTWFCTDGAGLLLKKSSAFVNYETKDGLANNKVLRLLKNNKGLFIGTSNGLCVKNKEGIKKINLPNIDDGLKYVQTLQNISDADLGLCINNVFGFTKSKKNTSDLFTNYKANNYAIKAFAGAFFWQQSLQNIWLTPSNYLIHLQNDSITQKIFFAKNSIRKIFTMATHQNKTWVGASNGLYYISGDSLKKIDNIAKEKFGQVLQLFINKKNKLWIATDNGLFTYYNNTFTPIQRGNTPGSNYCKSIIEDSEGKIWCATWDGIFVTDGINKVSYNTTEGLISKTTNCILFDSATNQLYVGTDNGLSVVNKNELIKTNTYDKVNISCSIADTLEVAEGSTLLSNQKDLAFYLSLPHYQGNDGLQYEYKLDDENWITTSNPTVLFSTISNGKHKLYVRAKKNGAIITKSDSIFTFTIPAPFYNRWWFWLLVIGCAQFLLFKLINQSNKKSKEKKLAALQTQAEFASLKQQAFTSLMNPHFIFNALNSVQYYVNRQDRQSANKYLSDFATLIRKNFDASQQSFVSLDEELETIRLYLELEQMRFTDKFEYTINLSKETEEEEWMLPSMVLQPFLENAILHGLMPLNTKGLLTINASVVNNALQIIITDNGIGVEKSKLYQTNKKHNSRGMQLIKERLQMLSNLGTQPINFSIEPLNIQAENPGAKITLLFPQSIYEAYQQQAVKR